MPISRLRIVNPETGALLREVALSSATTMTYAAMHVAEKAGLDLMDFTYQLFEYPQMTPVPAGDIVAEWEGRAVCLGMGRDGE